MKIIRVRAIPMSDPVPRERQHRTELGTKVKSDATLILVETDNGLTGMGAALGTPPAVAAIVEHELAPEVIGESPLFSERIYEKMYNGSRAGGFTEIRRIAALTSARDVRLAPHAWGSGILFAASIHCAMAAANCHILNVSFSRGRTTGSLNRGSRRRWKRAAFWPRGRHAGPDAKTPRRAHFRILGYPADFHFITRQT